MCRSQAAPGGPHLADFRHRVRDGDRSELLCLSECGLRPGHAENAASHMQVAQPPAAQLPPTMHTRRYMPCVACRRATCGCHSRLPRAGLTLLMLVKEFSMMTAVTLDPMNACCERGERQPHPESSHATVQQPVDSVEHGREHSRSVGQSGFEQSRLRVHAAGCAPSRELSPSPSADHASVLELGSWPGQKCVAARETTRMSNCEPSRTRGCKHARGDARIMAAGRAPGKCETIATITFECSTAIEHRRDLGAACDVGTVHGTVRAAPNLELVNMARGV